MASTANVYTNSSSCSQVNHSLRWYFSVRHVMLGLHTILHLWLKSISDCAVHFLTSLSGGSHLGGRGTLTMQLHQLAQVKLGFLEDFDFADVDIVERVDTPAGLLNVLANAVWQQFVDHILEVIGGDLSGHDVHHSPPDHAHLVALCVEGLFDLVLTLVGESNAEETQQVAISGLYGNIGLNQCLPLLDHRAQFIGGEVHAMEVGEHIAALHLLSNQAELAECYLVILEVSHGDLKYTALKPISCKLGSSRSCDKSLANLADVEHGRGLDIVPVLLGERVNDFLLAALFA